MFNIILIYECVNKWWLSHVNHQWLTPSDKLEPVFYHGELELVATDKLEAQGKNLNFCNLTFYIFEAQVFLMEWNPQVMHSLRYMYLVEFNV